MIYFDTSYLVKCYIKEPGWEKVREFARTQERISCSVFGRMELIAAFHRHLREGGISEDYMGIIMKQFDLDESRRLWTWLPLSEKVMTAVIDSFRRLPKNIFLRTPDALHLATAKINAANAVYTNDARMLHAASLFGISAENLI